MYYTGVDVKQDYKKADKYFDLEIANSGNNEILIFIGDMYLDRAKEFKPNLNKAREFYNKTLKAVVAGAKEKLEALR